MADKKGFIGEFKEFIMRGNVLDLAVGVIIGGAFSTITTSLTNDLIMPIVAMFLGGVNFENWKVELPNFFGTIDPETGELAHNILNFGNFINAIINFVILAFVIFMIVKAFNKMREKAEAKKAAEEAAAPAPDPEPTAEEKLLTEIRDLLKDK